MREKTANKEIVRVEDIAANAEQTGTDLHPKKGKEADRSAKYR